MATCRRLYNELKETLVTELRSQHVSLTVDIWSSRATQGYITLTVHWIDGKWQLHNKVLFTAEMSERHTAVNIADRLTQGCAEWGIADTRVVAVVHDNASNMTAAIASLPLGAYLVLLTHCNWQ
jgi:hypothetical protein